MLIRTASVFVLVTGLLGGVASVQAASPPATSDTNASSIAVAAPEKLAVFFSSGSASIRKQDLAVLDRASRVYTEGKPIVMILTATTDSVGSPFKNLRLSQRRALVVLTELVARGIPAERFQFLAKGAPAPSSADATDVPELRDRRVEIAWR